ncbi:MAG: diaminopimelate decarboxylase family protein [Candidatus Thorarchaeota archaeon]
MKKIAGNPYVIKDGNNLIIDSVPIPKILELAKTPFFIFLENRVRDNIRSFCKVFRSIFRGIQVFYSFKANFLPEICRIIYSEGIGAELVGLPELKLALKIGFDPEKIIIGGPYLRRNLIETSIDVGVKEIIVYNLDYLEKIDSIAQKLNKIQNVCLRIRSEKFNTKLGINFTEDNLNQLAKLKKKLKNISISSILSHYTTQMNSIEQYNKNIRSLANNFEILSQSGLNIKNLNLGGGFPEASIMSKQQLEKVALSMQKQLLNFDLESKNLFIEPGRYFVGDSGLIIAKIINRTNNRWIFLNIGNHICPKFAKNSLRFYNITQINKPHKTKTSMGGILPTDQDVLAKNYFFTREINKGELVLIMNAGAYTLTFSNRFPYSLPNIFLINEKGVEQIFNASYNHDFSLF